MALRDRLGQRAIEAVLHAIGVHGGEQDFARAQLFAARRPCHCVDPFVVAAAARVDVPLAGRLPPRVDGQHHGLRAELVDSSVISSGRRTAAVLTETLSAPESRMRRASATERMPPPTASGMKTLRAVRATTSAMMSRASLEAVMSRKTSSSAPCGCSGRPVPPGRPHRAG